MYQLLFLCVILGTVYAAPGHLDYGHYDHYGHDDHYGHSPHLLAAPVIKPVVEHVQVAHAPLLSHHGLSHHDHGLGLGLGLGSYGHDYGHHHAPIYHVPPPVVKVAAPVVKVAKHYAPATSYASVTTYKVAHAQPIVKAIIPQPTILKSYEPSYAHDYGYHHGYGHHGYRR